MNATETGAPGSLARFKAENPLDWWRRLAAGEGYEALDRYVSGSNPTHHLPEWHGEDAPLDGLPTHYASAWELGEVIIGGHVEHNYATVARWNGYPQVETFYTHEPLPPIRYAHGEAPGSGPTSNLLRR